MRKMRRPSAAVSLGLVMGGGTVVAPSVVPRSREAVENFFLAGNR